MRTFQGYINLNSVPKRHTQTGLNRAECKDRCIDKTQLSDAEDVQQPIEALPEMQNHMLK